MADLPAAAARGVREAIEFDGRTNRSRSDHGWQDGARGLRGCYPFSALPPTDLLLRGQLVDVFRIIERAGFRRDDFEWSTAEIPPTVTQVTHGRDRARGVAQVNYKGTDFFFRFEDEKGACLFSPGVGERVVRRRPSASYFGWDTQLANVADWVNALRFEVEQPDVWSDPLPIEKGLLTSTFSPEEADRPFTEDERQRLLRSLDRVERKLLNLAVEGVNDQELAAQRHEFVKQQIGDLIESSKRLTRKEWTSNLIGTMMQTAVLLALDPAARTSLGALISAAIGWLFPGQVSPVLPP